MKVRYKLSEQAKADLKRIYRRGLSEFGEMQADAYFSALIDRFALLAEQPHLYPVAQDIDAVLRKSVCGKDVIYYDVADDEIIIIRILGRQNHTLLF